MREIKFRVWDKRLGQFLFDGGGFAVIGEVTCFNMVGQYCAENIAGRKTTLERMGDLEISQFTGLHDKKGKEVWEGDIVSVDRQDSFPSFNQATIIYAENYGSFLLKYTKKANSKGILVQESIHSKDKKTILGTCTGWDIEVIGNIYENPELATP